MRLHTILIKFTTGSVLTFKRAFVDYVGSTVRLYDNLPSTSSRPYEWSQGDVIAIVILDLNVGSEDVRRVREALSSILPVSPVSPLP